MRSRFALTMLVVTFAIALSSACASRPVTASASSRANEIVGVLSFEHGHGYFVDRGGSRVWLVISENKSLVRDLEVR
jgi:hypothetical protein